MSRPLRVLLLTLSLFMVTYIMIVYVLPLSKKYNLKQIYTQKILRSSTDKVVEYNDDKLKGVISTITSSTFTVYNKYNSRGDTDNVSPYTLWRSKYKIPQIGKVVLANLSDKTISTIENGLIDKTFSIVSVGKPNKYYETPGGIYKIRSWETKHFSSLGHVYMPWSMQFSGNYFIHGIPYHEDGERVSSVYSGGCIRLEDEDSKYIYDFTDKNTYVIVLKDEDVISSSSSTSLVTDHLVAADYEHLSGIIKEYKGKKLIAMDLSNGVLYNNIKDINKPIHDSNIINLAVSFTALDNVSQERGVIYKDRNIKQLDILPALLSGDKDAQSQTIHFIGPQLFQAYADNKLRSIGLENTEINLSSQESTTTAADLFYAIRYAYIYKPYLMSLDANDNNGFIWQIDLGHYKGEVIKGIHRDYLVMWDQTTL